MHHDSSVSMKPLEVLSVLCGHRSRASFGGLQLSVFPLVHVLHMFRKPVIATESFFPGNSARHTLH
jgi:hypothetical protein